jgi:hypothetical protein
MPGKKAWLLEQIPKLGVDKSKIISILKIMGAKIIIRTPKYFLMQWHEGLSLVDRLSSAESNCLPAAALASSVESMEVQR